MYSIITKKKSLQIWKQLRDLTLEFIYPRYCFYCKEQLSHEEKHLCYWCISELKLTNQYQYENNPVTDLFTGIIPIHHACSFLYFKKNGVLQKMLHEIKYRHKKEYAIWLGEWMATALCDWIADSNMIIPVPIHSQKKIKRGYNQSTIIAEGIASIIPIEIRENLILKSINNDSQTKKNKTERIQNVKGVFELDKNQVISPGTKFIILDDVITTGSTLHAVASLLHEAYPSCEIKILVVASQPFI